VGMIICLETESGRPIAKVSDALGVISRLVSVYCDEWPPLRLARYIVPAGKTVFNVIQRPHLLADIDRLLDHARDTADRIVLERVRTLVLECERTPHCYVRFEGRQECH
jgi:hypothetical protein